MAIRYVSTNDISALTGDARYARLAAANTYTVSQGAAVADATGGVVIDSEARAAVNTLLARLRARNYIAT